MYDSSFNDFLLNTLLSYKQYNYDYYVSYSTLVKNDVDEFFEYHIFICKDVIDFSSNKFTSKECAKVINVLGNEHKVSISDCSSVALVIGDEMLSISSNAKNFEGTNSLSLYDSNIKLFDSVSNSIYICDILLCITLCFIWLKSWFGRTYD